MLETILKMYVMAMAGDVRSPLPHLFGPPGCGKSTVVEQAAELLGVNLHIINLSRVSPLELEGVQMPQGEDHDMKLRLLHATFWTQIEEGDIVLFDECLRAFPETFNGLLDILTSRRVADYVIPKAFFIGASNSTTTYDKALEDRLLHLTVPDPRSSKREKKRLADIIVNALGLMPDMAKSPEMATLLDTEVCPMYDVLDALKGNSSSRTIKGTSVRKLIGQAQLRQVESTALKDMIHMNNVRSVQEGYDQCVLLLDAKKADASYVAKARKLRGNPKLSEIEARNLELNLQLVELEAIRNEKEGTQDDDDDFIVDDAPF